MIISVNFDKWRLCLILNLVLNYAIISMWIFQFCIYDFIILNCIYNKGFFSPFRKMNFLSFIFGFENYVNKTKFYYNKLYFLGPARWLSR